MSGLALVTGIIAAIARVALVVIVACAAWLFVDHSARQERAAERRDLDMRAAELVARTLAPASPLACVDTNAGEAVEGACEKSIFATPETVAATLAYTNARLSLLADGLDYARRRDSGYEIALTGLRRAVEADRYGLVAHVLSTRDGCTAEQCDGFALLRDPALVKANMNAHTYEKNVERYAAAWSEPKISAPVAALPAPAVPATPAVAAGPKIDFPSAASIPPVSIMNAEPMLPAANAEATPVPPKRSPAPAPARKPATASAPPSPPATNAAAVPRPQ